MPGLMEWIPWIIPSICAGLINLLVAYQKFYQDCRSPFFRPWRSPGFWFWVLVQLGTPAAVFWFYADLSKKPAPSPELYIKALTVGFFFTLLVNANADMGFINLPIDKWYAFLTKLAYDRIAAEQTGRWTSFENRLIEELERTNQLDRGLNSLKRYIKNDLTFKNDEAGRAARLDEIDRALLKPTQTEKIDAVLAIMKKVRRDDLPSQLLEFGCEGDFLQRHFSAKKVKRLPKP
jgi:hypothetical protein